MRTITNVDLNTLWCSVRLNAVGCEKRERERERDVSESLWKARRGEARYEVQNYIPLLKEFENDECECKVTSSGIGENEPLSSVATELATAIVGQQQALDVVEGINVGRRMTEML